jgi:hypothetical protein
MVKAFHKSKTNVIERTVDRTYRVLLDLKPLFESAANALVRGLEAYHHANYQDRSKGLDKPVPI